MAETRPPTISPTALPTGPAAALRGLHRAGEPLVLVNAWDAAYARRVVAAGGWAVATSSAAIAESLGLPDRTALSTFDAFAGGLLTGR
jgi:2-methylisocitrate lyase-like PEP mutase family enzyme